MITDEQDIKEAWLSEVYRMIEPPTNWSEELWNYRPAIIKPVIKEPEIFRGKIQLDDEYEKWIQQQKQLSDLAVESTKRYKIGYMTSGR